MVAIGLDGVTERTAVVPQAGRHGGDGPAVAAALGLDPERVLDLSQTMNPLAPDPIAIVERHLAALRRYPDPRRATDALAAAMGVDAGCLLVTNGGAEAIALVAAVLGGSVDEPEFALHPRGAGPRWRSNPHSPSGLLAAPGETAAVWDEAFYPLATGRWTRGDERAVVVGSLTKLYACPGLRMGYVLAEPELIGRCRDRQVTWSVSTLATAALPDFLESTDLSSWSVQVGTLRRQLVDELHAFGLGTRPSDAPWVLVERAGLRERLAPHGVVVRDCTSFGMPDVTRIAVPSEDGLAALVAALGRIEVDDRPDLVAPMGGRSEASRGTHP